MSELIGYIQDNGPVRKIELCEQFDMEWDIMTDLLNDLRSGGILKRGMLLIENDTARPTLGIGWSCSTD